MYCIFFQLFVVDIVKKKAANMHACLVNNHPKPIY